MFNFALMCLLIIVSAAVVFVAIKLLSDITKTKPVTKTLTTESIIKTQGSSGNPTEKTEYGDYGEISKKLSEMKATGEIWSDAEKNPENTGFYCIETSDIGTRLVYNIDQNDILGKKLSDYDYFWVDCVNSGFYAVVNISGEVVDLSNYYVLVHDDTGNLASRLVINCYEAKAVKLADTILTGTLLAPNANVEFDNTTVYGAVYAKGTIGTRAFYKEIPFTNYELLLTEPGEPVTFENFNMAQLVLKNLKKQYPERYGTYSESYQLLTTDLRQLKIFDVSGEMIEDFYDDLLYMKNLEQLIVSETKLTRLDVSIFDKLKVLDISGTPIQELVYTKDSSITTLNLSETGMLGGIDFSFMTNLKKLTVNRADFKGFNEDQAQVLGSLLTELDVSENENLTTLDTAPFTIIEKLNVSQTSIKEINLSKCEKLTEISANYTKIKELDLSANANLQTVDAYGDYTKIIVPKENIHIGKLEATVVEVKK